jgi:predicted MFS family arabinose efflux permease
MGEDVTDELASKVGDALGTNARGRTQRRLGPSTAFAVVAVTIGTALFASSAVTPLYDLYQARWHFSSLVLTLVYAVYAIGVLVSLLLVGRVSDDLGRRPVLLVALGALAVAMVLFATAGSTAWLFAARSVQGLATGAILGAGGAALIDLHPARNQARAGLINGVASAAGLAGGAAMASVLVEYAPAPRVLPFVIQGILVIALLGATVLLPEPVTGRRRATLTLQPPRVSRDLRVPFAVAALAVIASWSVGGLYLSLGPDVAAHLLGTTNRLAGGGAVLTLAGAAAVSQLAGRRLSNRMATTAGSLLLAAGMALTVWALSVSSPVGFFAGMAVGGWGFGTVFMGGLRTLTAAAPAAQRAEVMSAFYVVAYLSLSLPAVGAGILVSSLGLIPTFRIFGLGVIAVALAVAVTATRTAASTATPPPAEQGPAEPACPVTISR